MNVSITLLILGFRVLDVWNNTNASHSQFSPKVHNEVVVQINTSNVKVFFVNDKTASRHYCLFHIVPIYLVYKFISAYWTCICVLWSIRLYLSSFSFLFYDIFIENFTVVRTQLPKESILLRRLKLFKKYEQCLRLNLNGILFATFKFKTIKFIIGILNIVFPRWFNMGYLIQTLKSVLKHNI